MGWHIEPIFAGIPIDRQTDDYTVRYQFNGEYYDTPEALIEAYVEFARQQVRMALIWRGDLKI